MDAGECVPFAQPQSRECTPQMEVVDLDDSDAGEVGEDEKELALPLAGLQSALRFARVLALPSASFVRALFSVPSLATQRSSSISFVSPMPTAFAPLQIAISTAVSTGELLCAARELSKSLAFAPPIADMLRRCTAYCDGVARMKAEEVVLAWPVVCVNEWGMRQHRVFLIGTKGYYRVAFDQRHARITHHTRFDFEKIVEVELHGVCDDVLLGAREEGGFNIISTVPDGRRNPFSLLFAGHATNFFKRAYVPLLPPPAHRLEPCHVSDLVCTVLFSASRLHQCPIAVTHLENARRRSDSQTVSRAAS